MQSTDWGVIPSRRARIQQTALYLENLAKDTEVVQNAKQSPQHRPTLPWTSLNSRLATISDDAHHEDSADYGDINDEDHLLAESGYHEVSSSIKRTTPAHFENYPDSKKGEVHGDQSAINSSLRCGGVRAKGVLVRE